LLIHKHLKNKILILIALISLFAFLNCSKDKPTRYIPPEPPELKQGRVIFINTSMRSSDEYGRSSTTPACIACFSAFKLIRNGKQQYFVDNPDLYQIISEPLGRDFFGNDRFDTVYLENKIDGGIYFQGGDSIEMNWKWILRNSWCPGFITTGEEKRIKLMINGDKEIEVQWISVLHPDWPYLCEKCAVF
jgi:hypothetical protein